MMRNEVPRSWLKGMGGGAWVLLLVVGMLVTLPGVSRGQRSQLSYRWGQPVLAAYEGWEVDADGSRHFLFGYMNANWEEELDVEVGPDNFVVVNDAQTRDDRDPEAFNPGEADRGQPTHFLPRRNRFVFRVPVPEGFDEADEVIWSITANGETSKAYGSLRLDYKVEPLTRASEMGAIGAGSSNPTIRANIAPELRLEGATTLTVRVGQPLTLVAISSDDGVPAPRRRSRLQTTQRDAFAGGTASNPLWRKPSQITVGSATGMRLSWYVYRGAGPVAFEPPQAKVWEDTRANANSPWANRWMARPLPEDDRWETEVTFDVPGAYVLRCLASDGALNTDADVTVTVVSGNPATTGGQ